MRVSASNYEVFTVNYEVFTVNYAVIDCNIFRYYYEIPKNNIDFHHDVEEG